MKKLIIFTTILLMVSASVVFAQNLNIHTGSFYKTIADFPFVKEVKGTEDLTLPRGAKILIIKVTVSENGMLYYFHPYTKYGEISRSKIYTFTDADNPDVYLKSWQSITHGTLVVPFKVMLDGGRFAPSASIGYYVGKPIPIFVDMVFTPMIAAGLAFSELDADTAAGFSAAVGLILTHRENFQVGLVVGVDHFGEEIPEDDPDRERTECWFAFSIGYDFAQ